MKDLDQRLLRPLTHFARRMLVGPEQRWVFEPPAPDWSPAKIERTSFYLHVPFCRHFCPYCPYTKFPYHPESEEPFVRAAIAETDWWAERIGPAEITSLYIGGGTPTLALGAVEQVLRHVQNRFRLTGEIGLETNPADIDAEVIARLRDLNVNLISLGVQSFEPQNLKLLGRGYAPEVAAQALESLARAGFASLNADLMFALPGQSTSSVISDLERAAALGADQITTYPLYTFPYTAVGKHLRLASLHMPNLLARHEHYRAISRWAAENGFERVSVWGFRRGAVPRYSSVTRDGYIGVGPGSGSHLPDGFVLNCFDFESWVERATANRTVVALRMPFSSAMTGWWWLYWRFYDTHIPLEGLDPLLGRDAGKARRWMRLMQLARLGKRTGNSFDLTQAGSFWLHLAQNYFALNYVNTLWTQARREPWPQAISI